MIRDAGQSMELSRIVPLVFDTGRAAHASQLRNSSPCKLVCVLKRREKPKQTDGPSAYGMIN